MCAGGLILLVRHEMIVRRQRNVTDRLEGGSGAARQILPRRSRPILTVETASDTSEAIYIDDGSLGLGSA